MQTCPRCALFLGGGWRGLLRQRQSGKNLERGESEVMVTKDWRIKKIHEERERLSKRLLHLKAGKKKRGGGKH